MSGHASSMLYRHTQVARPLTVCLGAGALLQLALLGRDLAARRPRAWSRIPPLASLTFAACLLSSLTVEVDEDELQASFAGGLFRRTIPLSTIDSAAVVRTPWYAGWGVRLTPRGLLYSIWGRDAVELRLAGGRCFSVGTDEPHLLMSALQTALAASLAQTSAT